MSEVLSQAEIDALLSALSTGDIKPEEIKKEEKQRKIKVYDFKRPDKLSKEQMRTIQMMHEQFARLLTTYFSAYLRTMTQINVVSVHQLTFEEFIRSIPTNTVMSIFSMTPLEGSAILEINPSIVFSIIDRLLGGMGTVSIKPRNLTEIERNLTERMVVKMIEHFKESWKNMVNLEPEIEALETNPQFSQILSPNDMVVLTTFQVKIGVNEGLINLCIPYLSFEPLVPKLSARYWFASKSKAPAQESFTVLKAKLERTRVPIVVKLGEAAINIRDLLELQPGDVIQLKRRVDEDLEVMVGTHTKFYAKPGLSGGENGCSDFCENSRGR